MNFAKDDKMKTATIEEFYEEPVTLIPEGISKEIGHFNVFSIADIAVNFKIKPFMPNNRRAYYKISLMIGKNRVEYGDKVIDIE